MESQESLTQANQVAKQLIHPQSTQQQKIFIINFLHPKLINKSIPMRSSNTLYQYRHSVSQGSMLKLFQNYQFTFNKQTLPEMIPIGQLLPESKQQMPKYTLQIKLVAYDQRTAKYHLRQVFQIISNPILYQLYQTYRDNSKQIINQVQNRTNNLQSTILMNQNLKINSNINQVLDYNVSNELLLPYYKVKKPELIQFISLSGFNPPPTQNKLDGNLFYIHLRVLESIDYHITASPEGFFLNQSKISTFNPAPVPNKPIYVSLFDLIKSLSQKFQNRLQDFLAQNKLDDNDKFILFFKVNNLYKWLQKVQHEHTWNSKRSMAYYLKQATTFTLQDWNQSFHITDKLPIENIDQYQVFDTKHKLYKNFEEAAIQGATMLIDGKISPLNPLQQKKKQIYIHNKIFYSIANETPFNHSQQKGEEAAPSSSAINTDLLNLELLYNLKIQGLHVLHMILINYRGYKVIAQCIIPGILSAQQNLCSQYGSIDDGKTIQTNPQFQKIMIQVAQKLHLQDNIRVKDGNGVQKRIAISPDIKGILGSNQKKYILDLLRISPRDLNYPQIENQTCVLRSELIESFKKYKSEKNEPIAKINVNIGTQIKFLEDQQTPKQKALLQQMAKYVVDNIIPLVIHYLKNYGSMYLTNSEGLSQLFHEHGLNIRYLGKMYNHPQLQSHHHIKVFLQRIIVTRCLKHLFRMVMRETNIMHMNVTLTRLLNCLFGQKSHIQMLEEGNMKENNHEEELSNKDGKKKKKKNKNSKQTQLSSQNIQNQSNETQISIKIPPPIYLSMKPSQLWQIVKKLAKARYGFQIKQTIYEYNQSGIFSIPYTKLATLQDLCNVIGMTLQQRNYNICENHVVNNLNNYNANTNSSNNHNTHNTTNNSTALPFHYKNIVSLNPRSKHMKIPVPKQKQLLWAANQATQKYKVKQAMQLYNLLLDTYISANDVQSSCDIYSRIGKIFYHMTEYQSAIVKEISALKIYQMGLRTINSTVIQSYSKLGLYEMVIGNRSKALYFLHKSLLLMLINFGETYPDILVTLANIARIYQQDKELNNAVNCYFKALELLKPVTSKYHINISFCYSSLASLHYEMKDIKKAIQYQTESVACLCEILNENDSRLQDAKKILKVYHDLAHQGSVYVPQQVPLQQKAPQKNENTKEKSRK